MTERLLTESVARALAAEVGGDRPAVLAVAAAPRWSGPEVLDTEHGPMRVVPCVSVLAVREALAAHRDDGDDELLAIVTDRDERELGTEVVASLWGRGLLRPYGWHACLRLFRAQRLDPALADARWLVDLLVDVAPARGYPPAPMGVLDAATAWRAFARHGLGLAADRPSLVDLLDWAGSGLAVALTRFDADDRRRISGRLADEVGAGAGPVLALAADGRGGDAVPLGLVADVLWDPGADGHDAATARGRLEGGPLAEVEVRTAAARAWGQAAASLVTRWLHDGPREAAADVLARAEQTLVRVQGGMLTGASTVLPAGFDERLAAAGGALDTALDDPARLDGLHAAVDAVNAHVRGERGDGEAARLVDACRLARRLAAADDAGEAVDLAGAARRYLSDGAWVDRARHSLADGSTVAALAKAYGRLLDRVDALRGAEQRRFARLLAEWSALPADPAGSLLPIEAVLDRVVAPLAGDAPVLVLVVDGMSHADASRILDDIRDLGWSDVEPEAAPWPPVVATLPTVTAASRTSLLCGRLAAGGRADERAGFTGHPGLRASGEPVLFHKADLRADEGHVAPAVRDAITDGDHHVVGVVVNGVDDHLGKGSQLQLAEGLAGIKPLRWLLDAAAEAARVVVLASDHGHILEHGTKTVSSPAGGGERWAPAGRDPRDDEVILAGPRVLLGDGRILAPAADRTRYISERKHGYHGGATPGEALCPLHVLVPASRPLDGYEPAAARTPAWWERAAAPWDTGQAAAPVEAPAVVEPTADVSGTPTLFDPEAAERPEPAGERPGWIAALLASPVLTEQRRLAGRVRLGDDELARLLAVLDAHSGVASDAALQRATGLRPHRLHGKVEALRTLLNVDAYGVVEIERDRTVRLNRDLLGTQFGIDG